MAISVDEKKIISGSEDKTVKIWDVEDGFLIHSLEGHKYGVTSVTISIDGKKIVSGSYDKTVKIWDAQDGSLLHSLEGHQSYVT